MNSELTPDGYAIIHFADADLPVNHEGQNGHAFGPYPDLSSAQNAYATFSCECNKVVVAMMFPAAITATINTNADGVAQLPQDMWEVNDGSSQRPVLTDELLAGIKAATTTADEAAGPPLEVVVVNDIAEFLGKVLGKKRMSKTEREQARRDRLN